MGGRAGFHPRGLLFEGYIADVVQPVFNPPGRTTNREQTCGVGFGCAKAGDSINDLMPPLLRTSRDDLTLYLKDLSQSWPAEILIEHAARGEGALLQASMSFINRLSALEIMLKRPA